MLYGIFCLLSTIKKMQNIIVETVKISEDQIRCSLALILIFVLLAFVSYDTKYNTVIKMRLINTLIILSSLIPLVVIVDAIKGKGLWIIALIGFSALSTLLIRTNFTKGNFKYTVMIIFTVLMFYWFRAIVIFT